MYIYTRTHIRIYSILPACMPAQISNSYEQPCTLTQAVLRHCILNSCKKALRDPVLQCHELQYFQDNVKIH